MRIKRTFPYLLSAVLIILILLYPVQALQGAKNGLSACAQSVLPALFPCCHQSIHQAWGRYCAIQASAAFDASSFWPTRAKRLTGLFIACQRLSKRSPRHRFSV